jgi:protein-S-isoprenylcysteine O-methyltransferase Ste14
MPNVRNRLVLTLAWALCAMFFVVGPMLLVRRNFVHLLNNGHEALFLVISMLCGGASGALGFNLSAGSTEVRRQRLMVWGSGAFLFLYIACAVLCPKIHFGYFDSDILRSGGLAIFTAGCLVRLKAIAQLGRLHSGFVAIQPDHELVRKGIYSRIRHPSYLGAMIAMAGIPLIFASWFPLLALPGVFVLVRWRMNDEEKLLSEQFGEEFEHYRKDTWRLIPHIY